jgi:3-isopropylmalate/(R)-2-methylmalate dehydratase small subunit
VATKIYFFQQKSKIKIVTQKSKITMAYDKFNILTSTAVPLSIENVDTDQIIPARFLKATERVGFGDNLFRDWRYNNDDSPKSDFVLNNPTYSGKILVGGRNFGSGSSREHAAWAVYDYGFRCVVSSFFADIFRNNCLNVGVLPVQVSAAFADRIFKTIEADPTTELEVNLPEQTITLKATGEKESFDISGYKKDNMINGFDDIDYLQNIKEEVVAFANELPY